MAPLARASATRTRASNREMRILSRASTPSSPSSSPFVPRARRVA
jgi:hypothetical protein